MENKPDLAYAQKKASNFVSWYAAYIKLRDFHEFDENPQWNAMLKEMKNYSQKQMLEFMPANTEERNFLINGCGNSFLPYESSYSDFWRKLDASIISFEGYEEKVLSFISAELSNVQCCIALLYRKDLLDFYQKSKPQLLHDIIINIFELESYYLKNACLPTFFSKVAEILKHNYPQTFALVQTKIKDLVDVWDKDATRYHSSSGWSTIIEGQWPRFDDGFKESLLNSYK